MAVYLWGRGRVKFGDRASGIELRGSSSGIEPVGDRTMSGIEQFGDRAVRGSSPHVR